MILREPRPDRRQHLGRVGEAVAEAYLIGEGYRVLDRRFRLRSGEIDLVISGGRMVVFVEVKTRRGTGFGAAAAVTRRKQRRMARVALVWLARRRWTARPCRFDVVEVLVGEGGVERLRHIRDAFRPESGRG